MANEPANVDGLGYLLSLEQWKGRRGFSPDRIRALLEHFGSPQDSVPCVHVAGTNGKGSVSVAIASILSRRGCRVVLTTSPHLSSFTERICIDGLPIGLDMLSQYGEALRIASQERGETPSFFEAMTAIAFIVARDIRADWVVAEVGLGGRLDATNVVRKPEVSVIVSVDFDHEDILGNTLAQIAFEKAGIIKHACPVVVGCLAAEAMNVVRTVAADVGAPLYAYGDYFESARIEKALVYRDKQGTIIEFAPALNGHFQEHNMAVAIAASLRVGVSSALCKSGVENVFWPGRLEFVEGRGGRLALLDAAHNNSGVSELRAFIEAKALAPVDICFGALRTKHWKEMISAIRPVVGSWNLLTPRSSLAVKSEEIGEYLSSIGISFKCFGERYLDFVEQCVHANSATPLVVAGSIYMMGEVRGLLGLEQRRLW